jgi:hypothetical protein
MAAAVEKASQHVRARAGAGTADDLSVVLGSQEPLGLLEGLGVDDGRVDDLFREDPLPLLVPAHLGHVAERHVADVDQHLVFALAVPDLAAGVTRIT